MIELLLIALIVVLVVVAITKTGTGIYIGPVVLGLIAFGVIWLGFGHFWVGVIVGVLLAVCSGGFTIGRGGGTRVG